MFASSSSVGMTKPSLSAMDSSCPPADNHVSRAALGWPWPIKRLYEKYRMQSAVVGQWVEKTVYPVREYRCALEIADV